MSRQATTLGVLLSAVLALVLGTVPAPAVAQENILFNPVPEPAGSAILIRGIGDDRAKGLLKLEFWAKDVEDLYGVTFALRYPRKLFKFPAGLATVVTEGDFLNQEGEDPTTLVVKKTRNGTLEVGYSRQGQVEGVTGSGHLFTIKLRGLGKAGSKKIRYRRARAVSSAVEVFEDVVFRAGKAVVESGTESPDPS